MDSCSTDSELTSETVWKGKGDWDDPLHGPVDDFACAILEKREPKTTLEKALIISALEKTNWVKNRAAKLLKIKRTTLVEKIKRYNLEKDSEENR